MGSLRCVSCTGISSALHVMSEYHVFGLKHVALYNTVMPTPFCTVQLCRRHFAQYSLLTPFCTVHLCRRHFVQYSSADAILYSTVLCRRRFGDY
jgi:hypothetical protein